MTKKIFVQVPATLFKDNHGTWIAYSKKYDISGYGETKTRAVRMFEFTVLEILNYTKPKNHYYKLHRPSGKLKIQERK